MRSEVPDESWRLFCLITDLDSDIRSANPMVVNIDSAERLAKIASPLKEHGLLTRVEIDDNGFILKVTTDGWLVNYQRNGYCVGGDFN